MIDLDIARYLSSEPPLYLTGAGATLALLVTPHARLVLR